MKAHIGMDAWTKVVHSMDVSPSNLHDSKKLRLFFTDVNLYLVQDKKPYQTGE